MAKSKDTYGMTKGQKNALKYARNYGRNKYYDGYNKEYKILNFRLVPNVYEEFDSICNRLNISKKDLILKELEVLANE